MADPERPTILVAEDNEINRQMLVRVLQTRRYVIVEAASGAEAIEAVQGGEIDLALVDLNMTPVGGFEFIRFLEARSLSIPVVIITGDMSSDILLQAKSLGVEQVLAKPVDPNRLLSLAERIIKRRKPSPAVLSGIVHEGTHTVAELLQHLLRLAQRNVEMKKGGPFAALVADQEGRILGEGVQGSEARADPVAHAEVMAIRQAADALGRTDLGEYRLYSTSEPTLIGKALAQSVGIRRAHYILPQEETRKLYQRSESARPYTETDYVAFEEGSEDLRKIFQDWRGR